MINFKKKKKIERKRRLSNMFGLFGFFGLCVYNFYLRFIEPSTQLIDIATACSMFESLICFTAALYFRLSYFFAMYHQT